MHLIPPSRRECVVRCGSLCRLILQPRMSEQSMPVDRISALGELVKVSAGLGTFAIETSIDGERDDQRRFVIGQFEPIDERGDAEIDQLNSSFARIQNIAPVSVTTKMDLRARRDSRRGNGSTTNRCMIWQVAIPCSASSC